MDSPAMRVVCRWCDAIRIQPIDLAHELRMTRQAFVAMLDDENGLDHETICTIAELAGPTDYVTDYQELWEASEAQRNGSLHNAAAGGGAPKRDEPDGAKHVQVRPAKGRKNRKGMAH